MGGGCRRLSACPSSYVNLIVNFIEDVHSSLMVIPEFIHVLAERLVVEFTRVHLKFQQHLRTSELLLVEVLILHYARHSTLHAVTIIWRGWMTSVSRDYTEYSMLELA